MSLPLRLVVFCDNVPEKVNKFIEENAIQIINSHERPDEIMIILELPENREEKEELQKKFEEQEFVKAIHVDHPRPILIG